MTPESPDAPVTPGFYTRDQLVDRTDQRPQSTHTPGGKRKKRRRKSTKKRKRRRLLRRLVIAAVALLVIGIFFGVLAVVRVQKVEADLKYAQSESQAAVEAIRKQHLPEARERLSNAADAFNRGKYSLESSVELKVARIFPIIGTNLDTVHSLAEGGARTADAARGILDAAKRVEGPKGELVFPVSGGRVDVAAVEAMQPAVEDASNKLDTAQSVVAGTPSTGLIGPVGRARAELLSRVSDLHSATVELSAYMKVLPGILGKSEKRKYFVAVGNNAEMNANGMILSYGILEASNGRVQWTHGGSVTELKLDSPAHPEVDPLFLARWNWANPTFAWQRTNVTPDFPIVGEILMSMYKQKTGVSLDGAIYLDGVAISYLLRATGPLSFEDPSVTLDEKTFVDFAMNTAYKSFGSQEERKEFLGAAAARAIAAALSISGEQARVVGGALSQSARERRLMMYSIRPGEESDLQSMAIGGKFPDPDGDFFSYTLQNFGGNKLDYYISNTANFKTRIDNDGNATSKIAFTIENYATPDLADYILGADPTITSRKRGDYVGFLTFYAPTGAYLTGGASSREVLSVLPDAGHAAFSLSVQVPAGTTKTIELEYAVPNSPIASAYEARGGPNYHLTVVPQPRIRPDKIKAEVTFDTGSVSIPAGFGAGDGRSLVFEGNPAETVELSARWRR